MRRQFGGSVLDEIMITDDVEEDPLVPILRESPASLEISCGSTTDAC